MIRKEGSLDGLALQLHDVLFWDVEALEFVDLFHFDLLNKGLLGLPILLELLVFYLFLFT